VVEEVKKLYHTHSPNALGWSIDELTGELGKRSMHF